MTPLKHRTCVGKFRNLKLRTLGAVEIVTCELEVELRATPANPQMFFLYWKFSGRRMFEKPFRFAKAQHVVAAMFEDQIEPWQWVEGNQP